MVECSCVFGSQFQHMKKQLNTIILSWNELQRNVSNRAEFSDRVDFVVNYQPFAENFSVPRKENGDTDFSYLSLDCFHLSQKGYAIAANSLWNNMLDPEGRKVNYVSFNFSSIRCPSPDHPYLMTTLNSF